MKKDREKKKKTCTYIGGQAVMEGVMMRGRRAMATAVRDPDGNVQIEAVRIRPPEERSRFSRLPFVRGVVSFVESLVIGNRVLMRSAEVAEGDPEQPSKAEKWLAEKHKVNVNSIWNGVAIALGILLAVLIFILVPQYLTGLTGFATTGLEGLWFNLIEGGIRLVIFLLYIVGISAIRTLGRVYRYHGAEHKTITCFEKGMELTPENAKKCSRIHDRCGTTFLFLVMAVSIVVFSVVNWVCDEYLDFFVYGRVVNFLIQFAVKILFLPVVAGLSYEVLKLLAKTQSKIFLPIKAPGFALQKLTTREPTEDMLEVAIAAFKKAYEMDADPAVPETDFTVSKSVKHYTEELKTLFAEKGIDESDAEWLVSLKTGVPRSGLSSSDEMLVPSKVRELDRLSGERMRGKPLWYVLGGTNFYGYEIKTDGRALIPRPETELLTEKVVAALKDGDKVLDLCTGSGCIAVAVAKETEKQGKAVRVFASDISADALSLARENADANGAAVTFCESDLLSGIAEKFDVIACNPPYIRHEDIAALQREIREYEPLSALDGGADGLDFYRRLRAEAPAHLCEGGTLFMECGAGQGGAVAKMFADAFDTEVFRDYDGNDRIVVAKLRRARA